MTRVVVSFFAAVTAIVLLVLYYTLGRATVTIEVEPESTVMETKLPAAPSGGNGQLKGAIAATDLTKTKEFPASPSGELEDKASGTVALVNTSSGGQTLIATTRLLSPKGILFRLRETVTIPADGRVDVPVVADQAGEGSAIGPSRFTIPGLRQNLQDAIYAESSEPMRRAEKPGTQVTEADIAAAGRELGEAMVPEALAQLREALPEADRKLNVAYRSEVVDAKPSVPAGTKQPKFTVTSTVRVTAVFYSADELRTAALQKLEGQMERGRKVENLEQESLAVGIDEAAPDKSMATLKVKFLANVRVVDASTAFKKEDLMGRTAVEVQNYFKGYPGVVKAEVKLWPFWVTTVPTVADHITLQVKQ